MASGNSQEIINYKRSILSQIINNENIVKAINAKNSAGESLEPDELLYENVFPFAFIPDVIEEAKSYITIEVSMPSVSTVNYFFRDVLVIITVICHQNIMQMKSEEPLGSTGATRADFIAVELDKLFHKNVKIGGQFEMELVSNVEGAIDPYHRCRILRFNTKAPNKSLCD